MDIAAIANELNSYARTRPIGGLQALRARLKQHTRQLSTRIFSPASTHSDYAFHYGGRKELQFNFGLDVVDHMTVLRYGVGFSLETSQSLPSIDVLLPKIVRFNEFINIYGEEYASFRMWYFADGVRSGNYPPSQIPPELCRKGVFIFLGRWSNEVETEEILDVFDQLLPLYTYVEGAGDAFPQLERPTTGDRTFKPGCTIKKSQTTATQRQGRLNVTLRHNDLQLALYNYLSHLYGADSVATEHRLPTGSKVDAVAKTESGLVYYEIKTGLSAQSCVRAALAQLLEYSLWPGNENAHSLVIVGEPALDQKTRDYLRRLNEFGIHVHYRQLDIETESLSA